MDQPRTYSAFEANARVASGDLETLLRTLKTRHTEAEAGMLRILDDASGREVDFDLRGDVAEVLARALPQQRPRGPGRPRLGVVSREVSLLPRHWEWLADQPSGASAAIRRLVDQARKGDSRRELARHAAATAGRAMTALAGDRPGFEEAYRALDAGDRARFEELTRHWPDDVRAYLLRLAEEAFDRPTGYDRALRRSHQADARPSAAIDAEATIRPG